MFRSLLFSFLAIGILCTLPGLAQPLIPERIQLPPVQYHNAIPVEAPTLSTAGAPALIARSRSLYDGRRFVLIDSVRYGYPSKAKPGLDGRLLPDAQIIRRSPLTQAGSGDRRCLQTFDAHNRFSTFVQQRWDSLSASWTDQCRQSFCYRNGLLTRDSSWNWNDKAGAWTLAGFTDYLRDRAGRVARIVTWNRNEAGILQPVADLAYRFNAAGNVVECVSGTQAGHPAGRRLVSYSAAGIADGLFYESWDTVSRGWKNSYGYAFVSGSRDERSMQLNLQWNAIRAGWDTLSGYSYQYNTEGRLQTMIYWNGAPEAALSKVVDIYEYAYNADGQRISAARAPGTDAVRSKAVFEAGAEKIRFYYEPLAANRRSEPTGGKLRIWPVPAGRQLHFDVAMFQDRAYELAVSDLHGRSVRTATRSAGNRGSDQIDLSGMPAGTYTVSLRSGGAHYSARFVVIE